VVDKGKRIERVISADDVYEVGVIALSASSFTSEIVSGSSTDVMRATAQSTLDGRLIEKWRILGLNKEGSGDAVEINWCLSSNKREHVPSIDQCRAFDRLDSTLHADFPPIPLQHFRLHHNKLIRFF
jgi:hypothetical protein